MRHLSFTSFITLLLSCCLLLSFSVERMDPPVKKATPIAAKRAKKLDRLKQRLARTQRATHKIRLQRKIKRLQPQQDKGNGHQLLSIISLIAGGLGIAVFLLSYAFPLGSAIGLIFAIGSIIFAIAGLVMSISALLLIRHAGDEFGGKGFAIAGLILSSLLVAVVLVAVSLPIFRL